jgi:hypothetical protein
MKEYSLQALRNLIQEKRLCAYDGDYLEDVALNCLVRRPTPFFAVDLRDQSTLLD